MTADIIIYHNPECGTSRNTVALIRNAGVEPHVIEYSTRPTFPFPIRSPTTTILPWRNFANIRSGPKAKSGAYWPRFAKARCCA